MFAVDVNADSGGEKPGHKRDKEDMYVNMHSNRLCVVGIAPTHPLLHLTEGVTVTKVDWGRLAHMKISGKRGQPNSKSYPRDLTLHQAPR